MCRWIQPGRGAWVRWRADGRELYFAEPDGRLMAVDIAFSGDGRSFAAGEPVALFTPPMSGPENNGLGQQYMVSEDGLRFLVIAAPPADSPVNVLP